MPVDEFGREIPAARGGRRSPSPPHHHHHSYDGSGGGATAPSLLYEALPSSRYAEERERDRGGGSDRRHHDRRHDDRQISRKRKQRSESPPPSRRNEGSSRRDFKGASSSSSSKPREKAHPSTVYNEKPMECQYLWKEEHEGSTDADYEEYRRNYCLLYVRKFFNQHMDDSWFRSMYSPLERYRLAIQERKRAAQEAKAFALELQSSIAKQTASSGVGGGSDPSFFVLKARLGNGIRQTGISDYRGSPSKASQQSMVNPIPATHVMDLTNQVLPVHEIPPHVTDDQLTAALMQTVTVSKEVAASVTLYSGPPAADLSRSAYLFAPDSVRKEIIQKLNHLERGGPTAAPADGSHVPRKEDTYIPKTLELVVDCSDAYGRSEVDADGKGGEPEEHTGVPTRKASVWVSTKSISPTVQVLSAALSSKTRINQDQQSTYKLAKAYDARRGIPPESCLETLLQQAVPKIANLNGEGDDIRSPQDIEDALDVTVAYLRRVHLLSYYNACTVADRVAEVLDGKHAASTIHLRLANADEILEPKENEAPIVDLLVQRLDDSVQKALDESSSWETGGVAPVVDAETDTRAKEIERMEEGVEDHWIHDHSIDEDGRARCAFHFCRKLFKDSKFLRKHLMKKHSEFLRAEIAKRHDRDMMIAWDAQEQRPVPPILVNCGGKFGLVPSPVLGSSEPLAADPEPELWRREEERREFEEQEAEARRERYENNRRNNHENSAPTLDGPLSEDRGQGGRPPKSNFVDIDDVKVEKVEMAFDSVEIPVQPPKKKKKKKLL